MKVADEQKWTKFDLPIGEVWWRSTPQVAPTPVNSDSLKELARAQRGNWAAIVKNGDTVFAITDGPRSFPILYTYQDGELILSSSPSELLDLLKNPTRNLEAAEEFKHLGFVAGTDTLIKDVHTVPAGVIATFEASRQVDFEPHTTALDASQREMDPHAFMEDFYQTLLEVTARFLSDTDGHQILIPLSGGADSRLFMTLLKEVGAKDVMAFTYGVKGATEPEISRLVATGLGYPWKFIELDPEKVKQRWFQPETTSFLEDTWSGNALPHIQDWYSLAELKKDPDIDPHGFVSPGHTVVGNEHDAWAYDPQRTLGYGEMAQVLAHHHYVLQGDPDFAARDPYSHEKLAKFLHTYWPNKDQLRKIFVMIEYNLLERQAKYINNSVRAYEHFGFQWALPMLETEVWDAWFSASPSAWGDDRAPYIAFTNERFEKVSGTSLPNYGGPATNLDPTLKRALNKMLSATGVKPILENVYSAQVSRNHPMAFQGFAGDLTQYQIDKKLFSGVPILGVYAQLFLDGTWTPGGNVVPPIG